MQKEKRTNGKAILSIILAIASVVCCCVWWVAVVLGIAAVVAGILAYRGDNPNLQDLAMAGIVVGAVGVMVAVAVVIMQVLVYTQIT